MIRDDNVCVVETFTSAKKTALPYMWAAPSRALTLIRRNQTTGTRRDHLRPGVQVTVPSPVAQRLNHFLQYRAGINLLRTEELIGVEWDEGVTAPLRQLMIQFQQADISPSTLGKCDIESQFTVAHDVREISEQQLFLQGNGGRRDDEFLFSGTSDRQRGNEVGNRFSGARTGLNNGNRRFSLRITQCIGNLGNHLSLTPARHQAHGFG